MKQLPSLLALLAKIAARFKIQVSEKAMAQLVPLAGAAGGAMINTLFMDHFQGSAVATLPYGGSNASTVRRVFTRRTRPFPCRPSSLDAFVGFAYPLGLFSRQFHHFFRQSFGNQFVRVVLTHQTAVGFLDFRLGTGR